jgi:hypothetical protein
VANSSKDIQLIELKDMIAQLNTTIKTLTETMNRQQAENDNLKGFFFLWKGLKKGQLTGDINDEAFTGSTKILLTKPSQLWNLSNRK